MHLVTPELDEGPPVTYCTFPIRGDSLDTYWKEAEGQSVTELKQGEDNPLFRLIRQHGLKREFPLIVSTIKAFSEGQVKIEGGKVIDSSGKEIKGYDLTAEINPILR